MLPLNPADLAAIEAAVWAHPQGVAYLDKIARMDVLLPAWLASHRRATIGSGRRRRVETEEEIRRAVLDKWEAIDAAREITQARARPVAPESATPAEIAPPEILAAAALPRQDVAGAPLLPDAADAAREAVRRRNNAALLLILAIEA